MEPTDALNDSPVQIGRNWVFPDGTVLPVISGGDGPVDEPADEPEVEPDPITLSTEVPEDLSTVDDLDALEDALLAEFDEVADDPERSDAIAVCTAITSRIMDVRSERDARNEAADADAAALAELRAQVHPVAEEPDEVVEPDPADVADAVVEEAPADPELVTAAADTPPARPAPGVRRTGAPANAAAVRRAAPRVTAPARQEPLVSITAAADTGFAAGAEMGIGDIVTAMFNRSRGLPDHSPVMPVASIRTREQFVLDDRAGIEDAAALLAAACDPSRMIRMGDCGVQELTSLAAAGGWCAPPETVYDLFALEATDGLASLPTIQVSRGSIQVPDFMSLSTVTNALWTWTETQDINAYQSGLVVNKALTTNVATLTTDAAHGITSGDQVRVSGVGAPFDGTWTTTAASGTTFSYAVTNANVSSAAVSPPGGWQDLTGEGSKPCLRVPCLGYTEYTLEAEGLCVTNGNLSSRAWPEQQARFVSLVMAAHLHRISAQVVAKLQADMTDVTITDGGSDAYGNALDAATLAANDIRSQFKMADDAPVEVMFPLWVRDLMRVGLAKRHGVDLIDVPIARINAAFAAIGIIPQYVYALSPLATGTPLTAWPTTCKMLAWPAGSYFQANGGTIDLGVQRDSVLNSTNDFTVAWSETFYQVGKRGPTGREYTISVPNDGVTG